MAVAPKVQVSKGVVYNVFRDVHKPGNYVIRMSPADYEGNCAEFSTNPAGVERFAEYLNAKVKAIKDGTL